MVDVHSGKLRPSRHNEIYKCLESPLFVSAGEGPVPLIGQCAVRILEGVAEQIFEALLTDKGITFEVEGNVTIRRFGKARKPEAGFHRQQLELTGSGHPRFNHNPRLLADSNIRVSRAPIRL